MIRTRALIYTERLVSKRVWTGRADEVVTQINDMGAVRRVREPQEDPDMMRSVLMEFTPPSRKFRQKKTVKRLEQKKRARVAVETAD